MSHTNPTPNKKKVENSFLMIVVLIGCLGAAILYFRSGSSGNSANFPLEQQHSSADAREIQREGETSLH